MLTVCCSRFVSCTFTDDIIWFLCILASLIVCDLLWNCSRFCKKLQNNQPGQSVCECACLCISLSFTNSAAGVQSCYNFNIVQTSILWFFYNWLYIYGFYPVQNSEKAMHPKQFLIFTSKHYFLWDIITNLMLCFSLLKSPKWLDHPFWMSRTISDSHLHCKFLAGAKSQLA